MHIHVLGSGAGGGFPQWNCNCRNCHGYRAGTVRARRRTQSSIAVSADRRGWVLFNASPDVLAQLHDFADAQPARAVRDTAIEAVVLIDSQIDHTTGLLMLRERTSPLPVYCTDPVMEDLTSGNPLFQVLSHYCKVDWRPLRFAQGRSVFDVPGVDGLTFTAVPLKSKAPPYSPHRQRPHEGDTIGVRVDEGATGKRLFYAPGLGEIEAHVAALLHDADCVMVDGTFWREDEMASVGVTDKPARSIGHLPQSGDGGMIEVLDGVTRARKVLIHINNTNPILDEDSAERAELEGHGIEVAFDGMEISP